MGFFPPCRETAESRRAGTSQSELFITQNPPLPPRERRFNYRHDEEGAREFKCCKSFIYPHPRPAEVSLSWRSTLHRLARGHKLQNVSRPQSHSSKGMPVTNDVTAAVLVELSATTTQSCSSLCVGLAQFAAAAILIRASPLAAGD